MIDLTGKEFGRFKVIKLAKKDEKHKLYWLCICNCGNERIVRGDQLKSGVSKSCGCYQKDKVKEMVKERYPEGRLYDQRTYRIWCGIKQRCNDPNSCEYKRYGARGITMCKEWLEDYKKFKNWALENGYSDELSIDRIDVDGNYNPENCKWSDPKEQANNRRNSINITFKGKTQTLAEWSNELGIAYSCLYRRIKSNWDLEKAFTK